MLKGRLGCASLMEEDAVVSTKNVIRVHKGALCIAKHMVVGNDAHLQGVPKVLKEAPHCVRHMVGGSAAFSMEVAFAQKVCMEALTSVLLMVVERGVLLQVAPRVHVAVLTVVSGMVGGRDASLKGVGRAHEGAQIFARHMVGESEGGVGMESVRKLLQESVYAVLLTAAWCKSGKCARSV